MPSNKRGQADNPPLCSLMANATSLTPLRPAAWTCSYAGETVKVFGFLGIGGMKLPYCTLNSVSGGVDENDLRINESNYVAFG